MELQEASLFAPRASLTVIGEGRSQKIRLGSDSDSAMRVAWENRFDLMCQDLLWGEEKMDDLGLMLRGLVETYRPENRFHLLLLKNIAASQWKLLRSAATQQNLVNHGEKGAGKFGLPAAVHNANETGDRDIRLLQELETAVRIYTRTRLLKCS